MANTKSNTSSRTKSKNRYNAKNYDRFNVVLPKGQLKTLDDTIKQLGYKSRNEFVLSAITEKLNSEL